MGLEVDKKFYKMKKFWIAVVIALSFAFPQVREVAGEFIDFQTIDKVLE